MQKSFFHKTIFRKNMTRFAPVWVLYTLCLLVELAVQYTGQYQMSSERCYWFAENVMRLPKVMGIINLIYGLVVAQMLFGDLYNSRMCNALHALPLRRESWLLTNVLSGLVFSFVPTLIAALALYPMLAGSVFIGTWKLPLLFLLSANLEFLCFFGIAVFCAMCVGSRFTMAAGYGLLSAGASIVHWAINTVYTPLLYGVITPSKWANDLTPVMQATRHTYFEVGNYLGNLRELAQKQHCDLSQMTATYSLTGEWWRLFVLAAVGLAFLAGAVLLYRKRNLECAGDAVAFPILRPVFQVLCTLFVAVSGQYVLKMMIGYQIDAVLRYSMLALGLVVGWFVGRMLLERSIRVFQKKNWYGLGIMAGVMALSLVCTHFDILGIETRLPDPGKVVQVNLGTNWTSEPAFTEEEDIEKVLRIHRLALEDRPESDDLYVRGYDGSFVHVVDTNDGLYDRTAEYPEYTYAAGIHIIYTMENGSVMQRRYNIWTEGEAGNLTRQLLSRWENVSDKAKLEDGSVVNYAELAADNILYLRVDGKRAEVEGDLRDTAWSFLDAVKADCAAGNMLRDNRFHRGMFRDTEPRTDWDGEAYYQESSSISVVLGSEETSWGVEVYPESINCIRWLQDHDLFDKTIDRNACRDWYPLEENSVTTVEMPVTEPADPTQPSATKPTETAVETAN